MSMGMFALTSEENKISIFLRPLQYKEIDLIWQQISRRELITQLYIQKQDQLELTDCFYDVENWDAYHLENDPSKLKELYQQGASFVGAFNTAEQLVGISVVSNQHIADYPNAKLLQYFYVDADQQGQGIGAKLMQAAKESAKQLGALQLYISATPSKRTVDFLYKTWCDSIKTPRSGIMGVRTRRHSFALYALRPII